MHKNILSRKSNIYPHNQISPRSSLQSNQPQYQNKYDSYTPRKRYMKEHEEYDSYRISHIQKTDAFRDYSPFQRKQQKLNSSRIKKNSNAKIQSPDIYACGSKYSQNYIEKYSRDLYQFDQTDVLKENTQKYVNKTTSRKQKLKGFAIEKGLCKNLYLQDEQNTDKNNEHLISKSRKQIFQYKKPIYDIQENICLTPRRLNKMSQDVNFQVYSKMSNLQNKIAKLQKITPKRFSTPKNSRVLENLSYNPFPQSIPSQIIDKQQQKYELPSTSRISSVSQKQNEIMSRISLGRLVQQQQAQTQVEIIQELSYKISSKLQSIIRNFG